MICYSAPLFMLNEKDYVGISGASYKVAVNVPFKDGNKDVFILLINGKEEFIGICNAGNALGDFVDKERFSRAIDHFKGLKDRVDIQVALSVRGKELGKEELVSIRRTAFLTAVEGLMFLLFSVGYETRRIEAYTSNSANLMFVPLIAELINCIIHEDFARLDIIIKEYKDYHRVLMKIADNVLKNRSNKSNYELYFNYMGSKESTYLTRHSGSFETRRNLNYHLDVFADKDSNLKFSSEIINDCYANLFMPNDLNSFFAYCISKVLSDNTQFSVCKYCGKLFANNKASVKYCSRFYKSPSFDDPIEGLMCKSIAINKQKRDSTHSDKVIEEYYRYYKAAYARVSRGKLDKSVFDKWAKEAKIKRSEAISGLLPFDDYVTWLQESVPQAKTN